MRRKVNKGPLWPAWFYSPLNEDCGVFTSEESVPEGWTRKRGTPEPEIETLPTAILDKEALFAELLYRGIDINPTWGNAHMKKVLDDTSTSR